MKKLSAFLFLISTTIFPAMAQPPLTEEPYSYTHQNVSYLTDKVELSALDIKALETEDALNVDKSVPYRVGVVRHVSYTLDNSGRMDILPDGSKLWRLTIRSPKAIMLSVFFSSFHIPKEAALHVYSGDRSQLTGPYTNEDVQENGVLPSDDIYGDEVTIEYYEPVNASFHGTFELDRISHVYRDFLHTGKNAEGYWGDAEGDCHYNVACPEGNDWKPQIRSVVCLKITGNTGTYFCSGAMINNVRMDKTPYVLTANHCLDGAASTFKFYFNYQTNTCDGTSGYFNRMAKDGVVRARADLNTSSDFMLLEITGELKPTFRDSIFFAGWDASGSASTGAAIHHPGGDYKKISLPKSVNSYGGQSNHYWSVSWFTNPNKGCTEQGSSGSPLFNKKGLIIGDLSNGNSSCDYPQGIDNYGKFSYSWTNNNNSSNSKKLKPWLDPDNTGILTLPGMNYDGTIVTNTRDNVEIARTFNLLPNPSDGQVTIEGNFNAQGGICHVYNTLGILVATRNLSLTPNSSMNFGNLSNGIYFVEIISGNHVYKSKMVIAK